MDEAPFLEQVKKDDDDGLNEGEDLLVLVGVVEDG